MSAAAAEAKQILDKVTLVLTDLHFSASLSRMVADFAAPYPYGIHELRLGQKAPFLHTCEHKTCEIQSAVADTKRRILFLITTCGLRIHHLDTLQFKHHFKTHRPNDAPIWHSCLLPHDRIALAQFEKIKFVNYKGHLMCTEKADTACMYCEFTNNRLYVLEQLSVVVFGLEPSTVTRLMTFNVAPSGTYHFSITYSLADRAVLLGLGGIQTGRGGLFSFTMQDVVEEKAMNGTVIQRTAHPVLWNRVPNAVGDGHFLVHGAYVYSITRTNDYVVDRSSRDVLKMDADGKEMTHHSGGQLEFHGDDGVVTRLQAHKRPNILNVCFDDDTQRVLVVTCEFYHV